MNLTDSELSEAKKELSEYRRALSRAAHLLKSYVSWYKNKETDQILKELLHERTKG